jgi:hypothetical protein
LHHTVEGLGKIAYFCGEMGKRDDAIKAFKETAELCTLQHRWLPTKTWVDAIDHAKQGIFTNKMVTTAINFICQSLGSKFSTTNGEFAVFHAQFEVDTGLEVTVKQTVHFYYVQPATSKEKPKVSNDIRYWQQQYTKFSCMRQSNRKRDARDTGGSTKPSKQSKTNDDQFLAKEVDSNLHLLHRLLYIRQEESYLPSNPASIQSLTENETPSASAAPPQSFEEALTMLQEAWKEQHPHLVFPEGYLTLEQIVEINGQTVSDEESEVDDVPEEISKLGRFQLNDYELPNRHIVRGLPSNYCIISKCDLS